MAMRRKCGVGMSVVGAVVAVALGAGGTAWGAPLLANGDFEAALGTDGSGATFSGWAEGNAAAAVAAQAVIGGAQTAQVGAANASSLFQNLADTTVSSFSLDFDFAAKDPGLAPTGTNRGPTAFQVNLRHTATGFNQINVVVTDDDNDGDGDVRVFGGSWSTVLGSAVTFSSGLTAAADVKVNHMTIVGRYAPTPSYDLYVTDADGAVRSVLGLAGFQGTAPTAASTLRVVSFEGGNLSGFAGSPNNGTADAVLVDNVVLVPEPAMAGVAVLGTAGTAVLRRRRRK